MVLGVVEDHVTQLQVQLTLLLSGHNFVDNFQDNSCVILLLTLTIHLLQAGA